ncbi:LysR family transcriptional regulator [Candidimonas nitroreducens]|uniref:LysR family transcriptional regulator n=1 Tax=Candidimonas nitroreducens TaxID=683354 RepID=A0A225MGV2_9BURK|nr:LysR family transcriptional regulator [Candidimonas nitroreducens]OWT60112.1 LysR family transcriptional regulator [Candidimonas nitroreducens]
MHDFDLTSLRLFVAVCDQRNLARAGEQAHLGVSAVSKRMTQLEEQLNVPLLLRHRRGVTPTPAGEILLEHARVMLSGADKVARDMAAYQHGVRGQVRMLASVSSITESLPDDIAAFLQLPGHAHIRVDIEERNSTELLRGIREGEGQLGVCWDATDFGTLQSLPYREDHLGVAVHPAHPLARLKRCRFEQTLDSEHVGLPGSSAVHTMLARAAAIIGKPLHYRAVVSTFDAALRCVRAGLGLAIVPGEIAQSFARDGQIKVIALSDAWAKRRFRICFQDEAYLSPAARLLARHLSAVASQAELQSA